MTKFESRVQEVLRREISSLQDKILDSEVAPDPRLESLIGKVAKTLNDVKDELMAYFSKVLSDISSVKKECKHRSNSTLVDTVESRSLTPDHEILAVDEKVVSVNSDVAKANKKLDDILAQTPRTDTIEAFKYIRGTVDPAGVLLDPFATPDRIEVAKRTALANTLKEIKDLPKVHRRQLAAQRTWLQGTMAIQALSITSKVNKAKQDIISELGQKIDEGNQCCSAQTQFLENVLLPTVLENKNVNFKNELSVIKSQLLDLRRLLQ